MVVGSQERGASGGRSAAVRVDGVFPNARVVDAARRVWSVAFIQRRILKSNAHGLLAAAVIDKCAAFVNKYRADENGPLP